MSDAERIIEYNKSIKQSPVPTDFAVLLADREYYGIEVDPSQTQKIEQLRKWLYNSKNPKDGPASVDIIDHKKKAEKRGNPQLSKK